MLRFIKKKVVIQIKIATGIDPMSIGLKKTMKFSVKYSRPVIFSAKVFSWPRK